MKSIKFDDGYETFTINGDPERAIRFSARDANILLRYEKAMDEMKEECGRLSEGEKENASTLEELNQFIFDRIDYIFNSDVSRVAFGNQSPLTRTSKWRCGPVERPVEPDMATTVPASTALPTDTISWEQCPYRVVSPLPWSIMT